MEERTGNVFHSDAVEQTEGRSRDLSSHYDKCGKSGRYIRDNKGIVITITSDEAVFISPRVKEVINVAFRLSEKSLRKLIGSSGSVLKLKHALKDYDFENATSEPVRVLVAKKEDKDED